MFWYRTAETGEITFTLQVNVTPLDGSHKGNWERNRRSDHNFFARPVSSPGPGLGGAGGQGAAGGPRFPRGSRGPRGPFRAFGSFFAGFAGGSGFAGSSGGSGFAGSSVRSGGPLSAGGPG